MLLGNTVVLSRAGKQTATSLDDVITARDQARLTGLFSSVEPYDEIETAYYVVSGLEAIGFNEDNKQFLTNACAFAAAKKWTNLRDIFYATSVSAMLKDSCKVKHTCLHSPHCLYQLIFHRGQSIELTTSK